MPPRKQDEMERVVGTVPRSLRVKLTREAKRQGVDRTVLIRLILADYFMSERSRAASKVHVLQRPEEETGLAPARSWDDPIIRDNVIVYGQEDGA